MKTIVILLGFFLALSLFVRKYNATTRLLMLLAIAVLVAYSTFF
ncbi:hypothetical protein [Thermogemmatispora tikiterensis]|jgi:hypothetical protein|nr:hypothetical protein [Thermogemmatispora tikiterensis]